MDVVILVLRYLDECCHVLAYVRVIAALTSSLFTKKCYVHCRMQTLRKRRETHQFNSVQSVVNT